jgi:hypothetical protein
MSSEHPESQLGTLRATDKKGCEASSTVSQSGHESPLAFGNQRPDKRTSDTSRPGTIFC